MRQLDDQVAWVPIGIDCPKGCLVDEDSHAELISKELCEFVEGNAILNFIQIDIFMKLGEEICSRVRLLARLIQGDCRTSSECQSNRKHGQVTRGHRELLPV